MTLSGSYRSQAQVYAYLVRDGATREERAALWNLDGYLAGYLAEEEREALSTSPNMD